MSKTKIEWSEETLNVSTGCTSVSTGCKYCYARTFSKRLQAMGLEKYKDGFNLRLHPGELNRPYSWKKPKLVFLNSMSDIFHMDIPTSYIKEVFKMMNETRQHTYQVLTKRPERALELTSQLNWTPNIWMGTSIENEVVMHRLKTLKQIPAKIRFLSLEPLIGPLPNLSLTGIHWVIAGGECGVYARPIHKLWVKEIQVRCKHQNVAFFFKQWGVTRHNPNPGDPTIESNHPQHAKGGCQLEGKVYREVPRIKR